MSNCNNCAEHNEEKKMPETIPYVVHEAAIDRETRHTRKWMIAFFVAIAMLFASNTIWLYAWMQYDYESYEVTADGNSNANYIGNDGDIHNYGSENSSAETGAQE